MSLLLDNGQCRHPDCPWCARSFFRWLKARMAQMAVQKDGSLSFAEAAATSNIPPKEEKKA